MAKRKDVTAIDPTYIPMVAAIVSGFAMLLVMILLLLAMALAYKHLGKKKDSMMSPMKKPKKGGDGGLYAGQEPQSAQYLVSSTSIGSFGSSPSEVNLDVHLPGSPSLVYYNRGSDNQQAGHGVPYEVNQDGFRPIQMVAADVSSRPKSSTKA